jgi:putative FmdB family regulatory protein
MPTYDYKCIECNYTFELFQKMTEEPVKYCPKCKGKVKRLIGMGSGPIFKGSGFYQTDYKNIPIANTAKKTKSESKPVPDQSSKSSTDKKDK